MRKGDTVRYIGTRYELMRGNVYRVYKRDHRQILIYAPVKHLDGSIHKMAGYYNISDFEIVK